MGKVKIMLELVLFPRDSRVGGGGGGGGAGHEADRTRGRQDMGSTIKETIYVRHFHDWN